MCGDSMCVRLAIGDMEYVCGMVGGMQGQYMNCAQWSMCGGCMVQAVCEWWGVYRVCVV